MQLVIPIGIGSEWQDNELRYCLRSVSEFFSFDVEVVVLGEPGVSLPWLTNCTYHEIPRFYPDGLQGEYGDRFFENYFCTLGKYKWLSQQEWLDDNFLVMYDDQLILKEVADPLVFENVAFCRDRSNKLDKKKRSRHERTILQALTLVNNYKKHDWLFNYETHAPRLYNKERLQKLFRQNDFTKMKIPFALSTLYGGMFYNEPKLLVKDEGGRHVCYVHWGAVDSSAHHLCPTSKMELDIASKEYTCLSYNDKGLRACNSLLAGWIERRYPVKSGWEQ